MADNTTVPVGTPGTSLDEAQQVEQARAGDMGAFSRLVIRYQDRILNTCWRLCGNLEDAQDLTQEAFLKALESIGSFRGRSGFYTWLYRIAVNLALSHRRKTRRAVKLSLHGGEGGLPDDPPADEVAGHGSSDREDPQVKLSAREIEQLVVAGLERLDDDHRAVIVLRDIESLDYQQIAEILEVPAGTVKSRLHRGRMELRRRLGPVVAGE